MDDLNYACLGFLWGSARWSGEYVLAQSLHKDRLVRIQSIVSPDHSVFSVIVKGKATWRLKISADNHYVKWMMNNGHSGRMDHERSLPPLSSDQEAEFLKGYFSVHYSLDMSKRGPGIYRPRLRFYASRAIVERLMSHLVENVGVAPKKPQKHSNSEASWTIYYQNQLEIEAVMQYLYIKEQEE